MTADFSKLLQHPDKDEIVSKLVTGVKPKDIGDWLKLKYPNKDQSHLRISAGLLKNFIDNNLDLYGTLKNDIAGVKSGQQVPVKEIAESLKNNKTYKERLNDLADNEIDIKKVMVEAVYFIRQRIEQVWDKMQENPQNMKPDYALIKWFDTLLVAAERYEKIVNESPDLVIQHDVNLKLIEQHTAVLQEAVRATMAEIDPGMASLFLEKWNERAPELKEPETKKLSQEKRLEEAQILSTKINKEEE